MLLMMFKVRIANADEDCQSLLKLINVAYEDNWWYRSDQNKDRIDEARLSEQLFRTDSFFLVIVIEEGSDLEEEIVGCVQVVKPTEQHVAGLSLLAVDPKFQGLGLASRLFQLSSQLVSMQSQSEVTLFVEVVSVMPKLLQMYERWGFSRVGTMRWEELGHDSERDFIVPCELIKMAKTLCRE